VFVVSSPKQGEESGVDQQLASARGTVLVGQESRPLRRSAGKEEALGDETIAVEGGILAGEGDQLVTVEGKPADPFEARQASGSLRLQQMTTVHLVQAVCVELSRTICSIGNLVL
jgi:hypothetical protein